MRWQVSEDRKNDEYIRLLRQIVEELKFGSVTLTVQDGRIVQIQKEEKIKENKRKNSKGNSVEAGSHEGFCRGRVLFWGG